MFTDLNEIDQAIRRGQKPAGEAASAPCFAPRISETTADRVPDCHVVVLNLNPVLSGCKRARLMKDASGPSLLYCLRAQPKGVPCPALH